MISGDCAKVSEGHDIHKTIRKVTLVSIRLPPERFSSNVLFQKFTTKLSHHSRQPRITARGGVTRNSGISQAPGCPKFTNEVQHFLYKVLRWDKNMNSFRWNNVARLPGIAKPGKQSAKSRQLWIARHRL